VLVVLGAIDVDVDGCVEVVAIEKVVVVDDAGADEGVITVVGVLTDEQEPMNKSAAIATPGRLNDHKESLSPTDSRRGLTGLPPIFGGPSKHTLRRRRMRKVFLSLHIHPDKGHPQPENATTLSPESQSVERGTNTLVRGSPPTIRPWSTPPPPR
jgi:hypothetical protein